MSCDRKLTIINNLLKEVLFDLENTSGIREDDIDFVKSAIQAINDYCSGEDFSALNEEKKENESFDILADTLETCLKYVDIIRRRRDLVPKEKMTSEKILDLLEKEYEQAEKEGSGEIYCLNIGEWLAERSIVICDEDSCSSSSSSSE